MSQTKEPEVFTYITTMTVEYPLGTILPEGSIVTSAEKLPKHCFEKVEKTEKTEKA